MEHTPDVPSSTTASDHVASANGSIDSVTPEARLSQLAERASDLIEKWATAGERHERAVNQLESQLAEFEVASARLQRDTLQKMQDLERAVHSEWTALRDVHEEPIKQLREQANSLTEVCIATAHSAQRGFDQAEARLASIETEIQQRILDLRREMQTVVGELRANPGLARLGSEPAAWPLDGVTRLHHQLRQGSDGPSDVAVIDPPATPPLPGIPPPSVAAPPAPVVAAPVAVPVVDVPAAPDGGGPELSDRVRLLERALDEREAQTREVSERARRSTSLTRVVLVGMALVGVVLAIWLQTQMRARVAEAQRQSQEATEAAAKEMAATREQAAQEIASARDLATQAQIVSAALAAPDLLRYVLVETGDNATGSAQALWSRTRGFVLSGSRLSPVPAGSVYQVWLITRGDPISAGTFTPDASGSATLAIAPPTALPVIGVIATQEPTGGSARPSGRPLLVRYAVPLS